MLASVTCKKECFQVKEFLERAISSFFGRALEHFLSRVMPKSLTWLWWCKSQRGLPWCCLSGPEPCCLLFYRWPVGGRDLYLLCQISGSLGFLVHPCPFPTPPLPGTSTSGRAAAWNPLPGVTGQTELHRTLSLFSGRTTCAPHLLPSWPAWAGPPPPYAAPQALLRTHSSPRRLRSPGPGCH